MKIETTKIEFRALLFVVLFLIIAIAVQSCSTQKHVEKSEQTKTVDSSATAKKSFDTSKTTVVDVIHETVVYRDTTGKNITTDRTINRVLHKDTYVYDTIHNTQVVDSEVKNQEKIDKETNNGFDYILFGFGLFFAVCAFIMYLKYNSHERQKNAAIN